ncbi:MAG TPA: hypothetical protein VJ901_02765 [Thermoanaerobaculia bacterium]|nr:hypothetical protein [Thermoanaerobaculia bacterium]
MKSVVAAFLLLFAATLNAQTFPRCFATYTLLEVTSGQDFTVPIVPVTGVTKYRVKIAGDWSVIDNNRLLMKGTTLDQNFSPNMPMHETLYATTPSFPSFAYIDVIAEVPQNDGSRSFCSQDFLITIRPDATLGRNATRLVVPVAGSVHGAFNSIFRTRVLLKNRWSGTITGRIVFHRTGVPGTDSDPSIPYSIAADSFTTFDDVAAAMQLSEVVGSLDVVPDVAPSGAYPAPQVRADLISAGANGGEYSAAIPVVNTNNYVGALFGAPQFLIEPPHNKRINVGVRTLAAPLDITAFLLGPGRVEKAQVTRHYAADFFEQTSLGSWFNDQQQPGDTIEFIINPGSWAAGAIVYFAETDNTTNDVTIVSPADIQLLNQPMIACANGYGCSVLPRF